MPKERRLKTTLQLDNSTGEPRRWAAVDHQGPIITACLGTRREGERRGARTNALNYLFFKRHVQLRHTPDRSLNFKVQRKKTKEWTKPKTMLLSSLMDDTSTLAARIEHAVLSLSLSLLQEALISPSQSQRLDISVRTDWGQKRENAGYIGHMFACIQHAINFQLAYHMFSQVFFTHRAWRLSFLPWSTRLPYRSIVRLVVRSPFSRHHRHQLEKQNRDLYSIVHLFGRPAIFWEAERNGNY